MAGVLKQRVVAVTVVGALSLGLAGGAFGHGGGASGSATLLAGTGASCNGARGAKVDVIAAASTYLGLTKAQVKAALKAGTTLAQLAQQAGKTPAGLQSAIVAAAKTKLDAAVTAGTITAADAATALANLTSSVTGIVNGTSPIPLRLSFRRR